MADNMLFVEERKMKILEYIEEHKKATVAQLCNHFKVSSATIRNDLRDMEQSNLLIRTHGGAMKKSKTGQEFDSRQKEVKNHKLKSRIADAACDLIEDGDTLILDTGSTTLELARILKRKKNITVVTNDIAIAFTLEDHPTADIVLLGGHVRKKFHCTISFADSGSQMLTGLNVDKAFMGVNGLSIERGATTPDIGTAEMKKLMISISSSVILLCDSSKFERNSFVQFASLDEIDKIVTDSIRETERKKLEKHDIDLIVCGLQHKPRENNCYD